MPQFKVKDNRELEILDNGITSDKAIIFHHGTPGHASAWSNWLEDAASRGIRAISYSRAGYGTSDRNFGRSVLSMGPENHDEFGAALLGEAVLDAWMNANAGSMKNVTGAEIKEAFGGLIGDADKAVIEGDFADQMAATMRSGLAVSFDGWIDDDLAFVRPWGFNLREISKPVFIWQGDDDFMVPHAHSKWLAEHIPGSQLKFVPGHGHISLVEKYRSEILNQAEALLK